MKTPYPWLNLASFCISVLLIVYSSFGSPSPEHDSSDSCLLDFNPYPYQPAGQCIGENKNINFWGGIPSTLCCRNALSAFSQALARHANTTNANIFLKQDKWEKCQYLSFYRQKSVSAHSCGLDDFYDGSNQCTSLRLSTIQTDPAYADTIHLCSQLGSSFDDVCGSCTDAILKVSKNQLGQSGAQKNDTERSMCLLAVVISVAALKVDDTDFASNLYSCLSSLDQLEPGYVRLKNTVVKSLIVVFTTFMVLVLILILIKYVKLGKAKKKLQEPAQHKEITAWSGLYRFSKTEIENAMNFCYGRVSLGRGSAGQVYKGVLPSGQVVAIKHINKSNSSDSFTREVEGLSRIRHPNLVSLLGCCIEGGEQYLVYEYCSAGNLAQHLLRKDTALTWERRVKILRDCALALRYLHHYIDGCIVHRDIKLTNILLTENLDPKLSDFGLAKMLGMEETKVFTDVRGTIGYMDPEYMSNAKLTCASDIYSFGIVALQILSGQKVIELDFDARDQLTRKAKDVSIGKRPIKDFEDPRLNGRVNRADFEFILQVAVLCVAKSSKGRPPISEVFDVMEKAWKNTMDDMKIKREMSASATSLSRSLEVGQVIQV